MIVVQLPNGQTVEVPDTDDPQVAAAAARRYYQSIDPEGFANFQRSLPISGFGRSAIQGFRGTLGSLPEGAGIVAGALGLPGEQTLRGIGQAISGPEPLDTRAPELRDIVEQPFAASRALLGQGLGSIAGFLSTGLGAGLLARTLFRLAAPGATTAATQTAGRIGNIAGVTGAGALASTSELEEGLIAEGVDPERARALAATWGPLIGAAETANLAGLAQRVLGRELTEEAAREIARRGFLSAMARRGGREAFLEALTEGLGETARQGVIAAETGNLNPEERFAAIALNTIAGGLSGGAVGAGGGILERNAARRQVAQRDEEMQPPPTVETESPPAPIDARPQPITTEEQAREYLFGESTDPQTLRERLRINPALRELTGQALIAEANAIQEADYNNNLRTISSQFVDDFFNVTFNPQTRQPNTVDLIQFVRAINTYNNTLPENLIDEQIRLTGRITPEQIARAALRLSGQEDAINNATMLSAAAGRARKILNQMVENKLLVAHQKGKYYTLPPRDEERLAQRIERAEQYAQGAQPAPPTTEQAVASEGLSLLTISPALPKEKLDARLNTLERRDPVVGGLVRALLENLRNDTEETRKALLNILNERRPADAKINFVEDPTKEFPGQQLRMLAISELEARAGQQPATAIPPTDIEMRDTTRPDPRVWNPKESPEVIAAALANISEKIAKTRETMRPVLEDVLRGRSPKKPMRWEDWQNTFEKDYGIDISPEQAKQLNRIARQLDLLDNLNRPKVPPTPPPPKPQYDLLLDEGTRTPVDIVQDVPGVGVTVRLPDGNEILIPQELHNQALIRRDQPNISAPPPAPPPPSIAQTTETAANEADTQSVETAIDESAEQPVEGQANEPVDRTGETPARMSKPAPNNYGFYTPEEEEQAERIFRQIVGPAGRIMFAQNLRLENLRGKIREILEAENETLPAAERIQELNGYAIGDLAVLSLVKDKDFDLVETAIHEGQHVAENLGLFTARDIALLNANRDVLLKGIRDKISEFHYKQAEIDPRELRAYAANAYVRGYRFNSVADSIFAKLGRFLTRLANMLRGMGFQTVDDVYNRFLSGEMAKRPPITPEQLSAATGIKATPTQTESFKNWFKGSVVVNPDGTPRIVFHAARLPLERSNAGEPFTAFRTFGTKGQAGAHFGTIEQANAIAEEIVRTMNPKGRSYNTVPFMYAAYLNIKNPIWLFDHIDWNFETITLQLRNFTPENIKVKLFFNKKQLKSWQDTLKQTSPSEKPFTAARLEKFIQETKANIFILEKQLEQARKTSLANLEQLIKTAKENIARGMDEDRATQWVIRQLGYDSIVYLNKHEGQYSPENIAYIVFDSRNIKSALGNNGRFDPNNPNIYLLRKPGASTNTRHTTPKELVEKYEKLGFFSKWFGSPTQMGRLHPRYNAVADVQRQHVYATNEVTIEAERTMAPLFSLTPEQLELLHTVAEEANRTNKLPDYTKLPAPVAEALKAVFKTTEQIFNRFIDAIGHEYYMPTAAATPQQRAAIERMWAKHAGKQLHQIPLADLQAANPEGAKVIAEIQQLRRPAYIPMMMSGSHYMAVYKKLPGGKKQLEKIAFFDPPNLIQRMRGQNPEQYFRQQFEKLYPDRNQYEITRAAPARMSENNEEIQAIINSRNAVDHFLQVFMSDLKDNKELLQRAALAKKFLDKQQLSRIFRPNDDKLLAIHDNNRASYLLDALPQYALGAAKIYASRLTERPFRDAISKLHPEDRRYFEKLRTYQSSPTEIFGAVRSFQFFWLLGGAIDTFAINALQPIQLTLPLLMRDGANLKHLIDAYNVVGPSVFSLFKGGITSINPDLIGTLNKRLANDAERKIIAEMEKQGLFTPLYTNESRGQFTAAAMQKLGVQNSVAAARFANRLTSALGAGQQAIEQLNRLVTFLAAYRAAQENPAIIERANKLDNRQYKTPAEYARGMVETSQFLITKEDRALIQRVFPVAEVATQFMSYPIKATEQMVLAGLQIVRGAKTALQGNDATLLKAGAFSLIAQITPLVLLGGVFALPLAELLKELIEAVWGDGLDLDRELRQFVAGATGSTWTAAAVSRGVPHAANVANLSRRLSLSPVEFNTLAEPTVLNLLGPTGTFLENFWLLDENSPIRKLWRNGDYIGLATLFVPRFLGNALRGSTLALGFDQYTRQGNVIIPAETVDIREAGRVFIGFPPPRFTDMRDVVNAVENLNRARAQRSQRDNMEAAGYYTQMLEAMRNNDWRGVERAQARLQALMQEIAEHNQRIFALAETNRQEFLRRLPELRQWNPTAIRTRALANYYGISDEIPLTRAANRTVRPQLEELRRLYNLQ